MIQVGDEVYCMIMPYWGDLPVKVQKIEESETEVYVGCMHPVNGKCCFWARHVEPRSEKRDEEMKVFRVLSRLGIDQMELREKFFRKV